MSTVEEIVEAIKHLPPEKRDEVRRQLVSFWRSNWRETGDEQSDLIHSYSDPSLDLPLKRGRPRRPPISIKGKPISETVIEDRR